METVKEGKELKLNFHVDGDCCGAEGRAVASDKEHESAILIKCSNCGDVRGYIPIMGKADIGIKL